MKKAFAIIATVLLCLSLTACSNSDFYEKYGKYEELLEMLENNEYSNAMEYIDQLSAERAMIPSPEGKIIALVDLHEDMYPVNGTDWRFEFNLVNSSESDIYFYSLGFIDNGQPDEFNIIDHRDFFENIGRATNVDFLNLVLAPGDMVSWVDGHPCVDWLTSRTYVFTFADSEGNSYVFSYAYALKTEGSAPTAGVAVEYANDKGKDLLTLRHKAKFEIEVYEGVYWVSARTLGESDHSNADIYEMLTDAPHEKRQQIDSLYEAMQLYQISNFSAFDDNIRVEENGYAWEHHKPGTDAVRTNRGCCATSANWLNYILAGDYDEVGFIATSQPDGNGHIFNYILHEGWYYIIDMTHYRTDWIATAVESGELSDYHNTNFIAGNIHKTEDIQNYVNYVLACYNEPPALMFMYQAEDCLALDSVRDNGEVVIVYEENPEVELNVIYDNANDNVSYRLEQAPTMLPDWSYVESFDFSK